MELHYEYPIMAATRCTSTTLSSGKSEVMSDMSRFLLGKIRKIKQL